MAADSKEAKMALNGPVFFLVQEQAKSVVAIQALQTRMAVLESLQERLMQAIGDVQHHLASAKSTKTPGASTKAPSKDAAQNLLENSRTAVAKPELTKSDSLNKDSGISGSESSLPPTNFPDEEEDELLQLLEVIDQKSLSLLRQVEGAAALRVDETPIGDMGQQSNGQILDHLLFEKVDTQRQLSEVRAERDELRNRLAKLELATEVVSKEKVRVQQELDATLVENQSLQERVCKTGESFRKSESLGYLADIEKASIRRKYQQYSEKSRRKVSSILREANILELQKQLLAYVMENDVLRAKLQQNEPSSAAKWLKIESRLRMEVKAAVEEKNQMREVLRSKDLEIASLKDRVRELEEVMEGEEDCVRNFGMSSTEDWREPGVQSAYAKRSNLNEASPFSPLGYGDFSKTQSLPVNLLLKNQAMLKEQDSMYANFGPVYDTGSFTEVPLNNQSFSSGQQADHSSHSESKDLVDLSSPTEPNFSSTSTLVQSNFMCQPALGLSAPNLSTACNRDNLQNWVFAPRKSGTSGDGARIVNGHLCSKGSGTGVVNYHLSTSEDLSSICTEFDPLSEDAMSCENFIDSLNLSIPLKPNQVAISQLSSIGDSLHSNSLDMHCASSSAIYQNNRKVPIARSVDGIRELFIDSAYRKRPPSSTTKFGRTSLGKSGRHLSVNVMNCMHETSDYSLL